MRIDLFGEQPSLHVDGESSYTSVCGTLISLVIFLTVLGYATQKLLIMNKFEDSNYQTIILTDELVNNPK